MGYYSTSTTVSNLRTGLVVTQFAVAIRELWRAIGEGVLRQVRMVRLLSTNQQRINELAVVIWVCM
jgi:hypothetical protein